MPIFIVYPRTNILSTKEEKTDDMGGMDMFQSTIAQNKCNNRINSQGSTFFTHILISYSASFIFKL